MDKACKPFLTVVPLTVLVVLTMLWLNTAQAQSSSPKNTPFDAADIGSYYAVIVGIADYPGSFSDLSYTDDDAREMQAALLRYANWHAENIQLLIDAHATASNIELAIADIGRRVHSNDVFLFYFSGHGTNKPDQPPYDELDDRDEYLCAYDEDVSDDQLSVWLAELSTTNIVVIVDTCFSGGMITDGGSLKHPALRVKAYPGTTGTVFRGDGFAADLRVLKRRKDLGSNAGCIVLTACDENELSLELSSIENGLFTYIVLHTIENFYDLNNNGVLSAEEIGLSTLWHFYRTYFRSPALYPFVGQTPQLYDDFPSEAPFTTELPLCR